MSKFEEIASKAKEKVNEAVDVAKNYDYKAKAEEIKEKASDIADKAKEYDYKSEAENIKKGGVKYFWNKHKKFSVIAIIILAVCFGVLSNSNESDSVLNVEKSDVSTNTESSKNTDEKFIRDDDFILEYASKSDYRFKYKIVERDKYNRYLVSGEASKDYAKYMKEEIVVIIYQIKDDYTVREFKETNPSKKQLKSIIKKMKSYEGIWNEEPFMTEITYGE